MTIGLVGAGSMARALARGWGEAVLCTDAGSGRAQELAAELGGEALTSNAELAERADVLVLAHKPAQLRSVAAEIAEMVAGRGGTVVSLLASTAVADLRAAYPDARVFRCEPNLPVEVRRGVTLLARPGGDEDAEALEAVHELFARVGVVVRVPEALLDVAAACSGVGPAYWALLVEAQVDAAVRRGVPSTDASLLVTETMAGTADLLRLRDFDTLALRRGVASPGGATAHGLAALERAGVRSAFQDAIDAVVDR